MPRPVIEIENLKKEYRLGPISGKTFRKNVDELAKVDKGLNYIYNGTYEPDYKHAALLLRNNKKAEEIIPKEVLSYIFRKADEIIL